MDLGIFIHFNVNLTSFGSGLTDKAIWQPKMDGVFTLKAAKEFLQPNGPAYSYIQNCWQTYIPFKASFLCWRLFLRKLPLDSILLRFGYSLPSKCLCCSQSSLETTEHVFVQSEVAQGVWNYFNYMFGLKSNSNAVKQKLSVWWGPKLHSKKPTVKEFLKQCIPVYILWELWVHYASLKFGDQSPNTARIIFEVRKDVVDSACRKWPQLMNANQDWKAIFKLSGPLSRTFQFKKVFWEPPLDGKLKVNIGILPQAGGVAAIVRKSCNTSIRPGLQPLSD
ncbi:hypothetical protein DM860_011447 [Cuscuta australis]|uniref:Reverse transcriptase zinc-binding domain-containing protein n=1 Tax=Cuscuta australis TaxID=267555 RepID=A0A328DQD7_9ASTE|nr:hypothetical protein DM860_011447 [Cuscuta australis]